MLATTRERPTATAPLADTRVRNAAHELHRALQDRPERNRRIPRGG